MIFTKSRDWDFFMEGFFFKENTLKKRNKRRILIIFELTN